MEEEYEEEADGSGSEFDSISDMSSLGSFGKQYAVKKNKEGGDKKTRKTKRKSTIDPVTGAVVDAPKKKKVLVKKKKKVAGADGPESTAAGDKEKQKSVKKVKKMKLKGLNDRVLGLDVDLDDEEEPATNPARTTELTPGNINPPPTINTAQYDPSPSPMSHTAQPSPSTVNTSGNMFSASPNRAPSPKINLLGSSRVSPLPLDQSAQPYQPQPQPVYSIAGGYIGAPPGMYTDPMQAQGAQQGAPMYFASPGMANGANGTYPTYPDPKNMVVAPGSHPGAPMYMYGAPAGVQMPFPMLGNNNMQYQQQYQPQYQQQMQIQQQAQPQMQPQIQPQTDFNNVGFAGYSGAGANAVPSLAAGLEAMALKSAESSRNNSVNNDTNTNSSSRGGIVPSAVSERRKNAAAARAAKQQLQVKALTAANIANNNTTTNSSGGNNARTADDVVAFSGNESDTNPRTRKHIQPTVPATVPESNYSSSHSQSKRSPPTSAVSTDQDTPRQPFDPVKTVVSSAGAAAVASPPTSASSQQRSKNQRGKKITVEADNKSDDSSLSDSSADRRRRKKKDKEKKKLEATSVKERTDKEAREKEKEKEKQREKEKEKEDDDSSTPSVIHMPDEPAPLSKKLSKRGLSFNLRGSEPAFCKLIKSTTYLNAIKIAHSDVPKVLCASADSTVQIYTMIDGTQLPSLVGHTDRVISLAVSNPFMYADKGTTSGKPTLKTLVASGSRDEQLRIWDMDSARCLHSIHAHKSPIWAVGIAVRPNGDVIVISTSGDGSMRSWNGKTGKKINNFKGHSDKILSVFIMNPLSENPLVLSAGADKKIRVWELLTGAHIRMLEGHEDEINSVVAGSFSGISSLVPISHLNDNDKTLADVSGLDSSKSTVIVSASKDLTVRVWDFRSGHLLFELLGHTACVYEVSIMRARDTPLAKGNNIIPPGTPIIVSCSEDATIKLWNLVSGKLVKSLKYHSVSVRGIDCATVLQTSEPGSGVSLIASCGWDKTIQFHELGEALYAKNESSCTVM